MKETMLIKNGHVIDPDDGTDEEMDLLIEDGKIKRKAPKLSIPADRIIDARGLFVLPGLIDLHVHLREPGQTEKEDIHSGSLAAAHGGFTTICAMPNTKPVMDHAGLLDECRKKAAGAAVNVLFYGAVTKGEKGEELSSMEEMAEHGAVGFSEDGRSVLNAGRMLEAMQIAARLGLPMMDHCEDPSLRGEGVVNLDEHSIEEQLPGISNATEDVIVARDLILAKASGVHLHLCHCSTEGSYQLLKYAKELGADVSGEVTPHNFTLTSSDRLPDDANFKMNPPLRTKKDRDALRKGLQENVFEVIATDHAPHTKEEKARGLRKAPCGVTGLETALSVAYTELVSGGILSLSGLVEKMSTNPARILHLKDRGRLREGAVADLVIFDPKAEYRIDPQDFLSKGKSTPFKGRKVRGKVIYTLSEGRIVYQDKEALPVSKTERPQNIFA